MRKIDHLVYCVHDLNSAMDWFETQLGIRPIFGGYHTTQGTKNALVDLGNDIYLELLAIDESNTKIKSPRWMGIDFLEKPQLTRWALKSENLQRDKAILQRYHPNMNVIQGGSRQLTNGKTLAWEILMPLTLPAIEVMPFALDWRMSTVHPTTNLPKECQLIGLELRHPNPMIIQPFFDELSLKIKVLQNEIASIVAIIDTQNGVVRI